LHPAEARRAHADGRAVVDDADRASDGSHLLELWRMRASMYPDDVDLLERFMIDCLKAGDLAAEGHRLVARYPLEDRLPLVSCPTLIVAPTHDAHAFPAVPGLDAALPHAVVTPVEGGMVPLPDQLPADFAAAVEAFLDDLSR
jgi:pimeloyl-ACP methyl ester carboxylesterase